MAEEDDWETADLSSVVPSKPRLSKPAPSLRPSAPTFSFNPPPPGPGTSRPPQAQTNTPRLYDPASGSGPSNQHSQPPPSALVANPAVVGRSRDRDTAGIGAASAPGLGPGPAVNASDGGDDWFRGPKVVTNRQIWDSA
ncbi:hypothetical protein EHS25_003614 [Saitozyma podzolica]|uniref:Uncharacterized protein n=1 Tax=Saitozyma podzolica TaxID=1890683 RepID=A0A427Y7Q3_9TREE|nr:hypothetical protein EHS25_003614 [Saitozyma podzolica]